MLQEVMTKPGEIIFREIPVPEITEDQVLVKIMRIGICGSDIHVYHGKHPFTKYPVTQGHEVSGEIVKLGDKVTQFHVGQKITIEPQVYCGHCYPCRHGKYNLCEELKVMGFQTTGTASEYFAVDASKVTPIPEEMSYEEGAMIEPLAVAVHGVKQMGDVTGMNIVVIGAGPIGNLVAQTAKGMGAAKVMITDVSDLRLEKAKECGIDVCVNTKNKDFGEAMVEAFGPDKADVIYDCAGNNITMGQAIKYARKGSVIVLVAVFAGMAEIDLAVANDHELDIKSTMMYRHDDYVDAIRLVNEKKVHLQPLISKVFPFRDYLKAYQYIDDNRETTMKVIINVQEQEGDTMDNKYGVTGIAHIGIPTNDMEKTIEFYRNLGFQVLLETYNEKACEKVAFLQLQNYCIETFENHQAVMADGAYQHVALDVADINAAYDRICAEGHKIITNGIEALPFWENGVKFFMIKGPNEEKIEFCQKL